MRARLAYPLRYVRPHPGPRPPVWRVIARRRWKRAILERNLAKKWNFGHVYGSGPRMTEVTAENCERLTGDTPEALFDAAVRLRDSL